MMSQYNSYFLLSDRLSSKVGKPAKIVAPEHFEDFLLALERDSSLPQWLKAVVALGMSVGGRVTEVLQITKRQIQTNGTVIGIKVLKKRRDGVVRNGLLHPIAMRIVASYASSKRPNEYLFSGIPRQRVHRWVRKCFGSDPHALFRHSFVSLLVARGKEGLVIARLLRLSSVSVAYGYVHIAAEKEMRAVYEAAA